jgi:hypothetical protein
MELYITGLLLIYLNFFLRHEQTIKDSKYPVAENSPALKGLHPEQEGGGLVDAINRNGTFSPW